MKIVTTEIADAGRLRDRMLNLRVRGERQKEHLAITLNELKESVRPINLARQALQTARSSGKENQAMKVVFGLGGSVVARQLLMGKPKGFFGQLWSAGVQIFLTRALSKRLDVGKRKKANEARIILGNSGVRFDPPVHFLS